MTRVDFSVCNAFIWLLPLRTLFRAENTCSGFFFVSLHSSSFVSRANRVSFTVRATLSRRVPFHRSHLSTSLFLPRLKRIRSLTVFPSRLRVPPTPEAGVHPPNFLSFVHFCFLTFHMYVLGDPDTSFWGSTGKALGIIIGLLGNMGSGGFKGRWERGKRGSINPLGS